MSDKITEIIPWVFSSLIFLALVLRLISLRFTKENVPFSKFFFRFSIRKYLNDTGKKVDTTIGIVVALLIIFIYFSWVVKKFGG